MADFRAPGPLEDPFLQPQLRASEILGHSDVRHCVVGDTVARILGHSLIVFQLYLAVADEQLEDARSILLNHNFSDFPQDDFLYVDENATKDSPSGWPGYRLVSQRRHSGIILVPASLWHLDLRPASFAVNTFLLPDTNCRFPTRLFYLDALIDAIIERFSNPGFNRRITRYLDYQYSCLLTVLPKDLLALLPAEDQFFIDLFYKVLLPSARKKVCFQRQQIRMGLTSVEAAKQSIPRKDLQVAAAKAKYQKMDIQDENSNNLS